jgi:hypothetical protein
MGGQGERGLAVAGGAVPGPVCARGLRGKPGEEAGRIGRPVARVVRGVARKVVGGQGFQTRSMMIAMPWPTPMHMVHKA